MATTKRALITTLLLPVFLLVAACGGQSSGSSGSGENYPSDTVKILVSSEPGSPVDTMARALADAMKATGFEQPVVVETRTGGSGAVALSTLAGAPADGHTLYAMTRSQAVMFAGGEIDAFGPEALEYVTRLQDDPYIWAVQASSDFQTMDDLIAYAKKNPSALNVGGFGTRSAHHLAAMRIAEQAGIEVTWAPFDGGSAAVTALLGGHIDVANTNPGQVLEHVRAGKLRVLGVGSEKAVQGLPEGSRFQQQGIDYVGSHWRGIVAPAGIPEPVHKQLVQAIKRAYDHKSFQDLLKRQKVEPGYMPPEKFGPYVHDEIEKAGTLLNKAELN